MNISLQYLPLPPTDNKLRRGSWKNRGGYKSLEYRAFETEIEIWYHRNIGIIKEMQIKIKPNQLYFIEVFLYLSKEKILKKDGNPKIKSNDCANFNKAAHDAISKILQVDDAMFNDQRTNRRITKESFEYMDVFLKEMDLSSLEDAPQA